VVLPATIVTVAVMKLAPVGNVALAAAVDDDPVPLKGLDVTLTGFPPDSGTTLTVAVVPREIPEATNSMVVVPDWGGSVISNCPAFPPGGSGAATPPTDVIFSVVGRGRTSGRGRPTEATGVVPMLPQQVSASNRMRPAPPVCPTI
jgi:hypothetical protein